MIELPTAADLKTRYPEFTQVSDALIGDVIGEAAHLVDETWVEADRKPALLAYAAHLLSLEGYPTRAANPTAPIPATAGREVLSRRVGDVSVQYAQTTTAAEGTSPLGNLASTAYGRRFKQLLRLNAATFTVL